MRVSEARRRLLQAFVVIMRWGLDINKVKMDGVLKEKVRTIEMAH